MTSSLFKNVLCFFFWGNSCYVLLAVVTFGDHRGLTWVRCAIFLKITRSRQGPSSEKQPVFQSSAIPGVCSRLVSCNPRTAGRGKGPSHPLLINSRAEAGEAQEIEEGPGGWSSDRLHLKSELTATGLAWHSQGWCWAVRLLVFLYSSYRLYFPTSNVYTLLLHVKKKTPSQTI